jgi:hypothetical protein
MDINASIIDQRITGIVNDNAGLLPQGANNVEKQRSAAFVLLCISTALELTLEEAADLLTEGGNDAGVDGVHIGEVDDGEFTVTLFQGKYKMKELDGTANFPENAVQKAVNTVATLFDPNKQIELNPLIAPKVEEIRSLVRDGYIPNVRFMLCNNGMKWNEIAQGWIDRSDLPQTQTSWVHFNHDSIVDILRKTKTVDDSLRFTGQAVVEDFNFRRVLIGKVQVSEIAELFNRHNDFLLERNIRRYLGLHSNRVNSSIHETLRNDQKRTNFYFFNNGITIICKKFRHNALQGTNYQVKLENMQVINGGQTCKTIQQTLSGIAEMDKFENTYVLVRVYELADDDQNFVREITFATNSQNPVDLRDLRSNDEIQRQLEIGMKDLGYTYKRQRDDSSSNPSNIIASAVVAESVLAIWRMNPHQAKFRRKELFGVLYEEIFSKLNSAQAILAVLIFRFVENQRKKAVVDHDPFIPYASHYIAMVVGVALLGKAKLVNPSEITHRNFKILLTIFEQAQSEIYATAVEDISVSLKNLYGDRTVSLQQLSATFRRGDLLEYLNTKPKTE